MARYPNWRDYDEVFAFLPKQTPTGWVWLRRVRRRWNWDLNHWIDSSGYSGCDGGWEYAEIPERTYVS